MFCPTCGAEYTQKINYCKRCGANMATPTNSVEVHVPRPRFAAMFWAIALMALVGLITCFTAFDSFADEGLRGDHLIVPFVMGLLFIGAIAGLLIWQLSRIVSVFRDAVQTPKVTSQVTLPPQPSYQTPPLAAPTDPISSISEHTTRSFDPVIYLEAEKRRQRD